MNDKLTKCLGCGVLITLLTSEPVMPILCRDCEYKKEFHINEPNYLNTSISYVSSQISSTITSSTILPTSKG